MRYMDFRDSIKNKLIKYPAGLTWRELKKSLDLPYNQPCPEWIKSLEGEIGLERKEKKGNALIWKLKHV
jgi:hypothetical protein